MNLMRILMFLFIAGPALAGPLLDRPTPVFRFEAAPLASALRVVGHAAQATVVAEPELAGKVTADLPAGTLRTALGHLVLPLGLWFEEKDGVVSVRRMKTMLYPVDYPQLIRSGSGSASITLGGANGGTGSQGLPLNGAAQTTNANGTAAGSDATQVSISQENQNTFWTTLEAELRTMLKEGDTFVLNRFSGLVQVTAPVNRQEIVQGFIETVNRRIGQQVEIEARLVEVTLHDERKLGIDWDLATVALGGGNTLSAGSAVEVAGVGGTLLGASSFRANVGIGKTGAVLNALRQQGELRTVAQPRLRALNNQTAFIKVGEDRPFFRLAQSTSFSTGGTANPVNQTQENYSISTITIGTILAVTPQVDGNGVITLDVLPAITRLQAIVTSPDGKQTAPVTEVKQASTIVRLRDGETAVIGGLISEDEGTNGRSVPGLGAVPLVGSAFRSEARLRNRTELVIFLTPRVVKS